MIHAERRSGVSTRTGADDQLAAEVGPEDNRIVRLPVRSLTAALDYLDGIGLCACWTAPRRRRCKARWSR
jgi:hypothetical protein